MSLNATPEWFNVKDYGAKGDGQADDSNAIRIAFYTLRANGGGTL